jgi:hypothetical protein
MRLAKTDTAKTEPTELTADEFKQVLQTGKCDRIDCLHQNTVVIDNVIVSEKVNLASDETYPFTIDIRGGVFSGDFLISRCKFLGYFLISGGEFARYFMIYGGEFSNGFHIYGGKFSGTFLIKGGTFSGGFQIYGGTFSSKLEIHKGEFPGGLEIHGGEFSQIFEIHGGSFSRHLKIYGGKFLNYFLIYGGEFPGSFEIYGGAFSGELWVGTKSPVRKMLIQPDGYTLQIHTLTIQSEIQELTITNDQENHVSIAKLIINRIPTISSLIKLNLNSLQLSDHDSTGNFATRRCTINQLRIESFNNFGKITFDSLRPLFSEVCSTYPKEEPQIIISNADLGTTNFISCSLDEYTIKVDNSKLVDIFHTDTAFPKEITTSKADPDQKYHQLRDTYDQLQIAAVKQGDRITALEFQSQSLAFYKSHLESIGINRWSRWGKLISTYGICQFLKAFRRSGKV